jgi:diacylglycerol kinase (ATP)
MKATLIINPRSGKRKAPTIIAAAERMAKELGIQLEVKLIEGIGHGTELARSASEGGQDRVVFAGGDGTLNAVARGLIGTTTPLGIVPMGSGNGYARSLKLPLKPEAALRIALTGKAAPMDVCYLNDMAFIGTAGIGFDARVSWEFDKSKGRGLWGYMRIILQQILSAKPMPITVEAIGTTVKESVLMLVFANTREFGNGAIISPGSAPDDGLAELQVVRKPGLLGLVRAFYDIYTGGAQRSPHIRSIVTDRALIRQPDVIAHMDGEPVEVGKEVRFRLEAQKLWVVR